MNVEETLSKFFKAPMAIGAHLTQLKVPDVHTMWAAILNITISGVIINKVLERGVKDELGFAVSAISQITYGLLNAKSNNNKNSQGKDE